MTEPICAAIKQSAFAIEYPGRFRQLRQGLFTDGRSGDSIELHLIEAKSLRESLDRHRALVPVRSRRALQQRLVHLDQFIEATERNSQLYDNLEGRQMQALVARNRADQLLAQFTAQVVEPLDGYAEYDPDVRQNMDGVRVALAQLQNALDDLIPHLPRESDLTGG